LRAKAEIDLLRWAPGPAIDSLDKALAADPQSVPSNLDLAIAYSQKQEYEKALDILDKLLRKNPENAIALYNRALVNEHLAKWQQAVSDWQAFLQAETDSGWAAESRKHLVQRILRCRK
jgi:tetratricopeptide (TPR) repeat protein